MTTEARRNALYSRLQEVLGDEPAATLMTMLPGAEPATKSDLSEIGDRLTAGTVEVRSELSAEIAGLRSEMKEEIAGLRSEMKTEIAALRSEMLDIRTDIRELRSTVQGPMCGLS